MLKLIQRLVVAGALLLVALIAIGLLMGPDKPHVQKTAAPPTAPAGLSVSVQAQAQKTLDDGLAVEAQWQKAKAKAAGIEPPDPEAIDRVAAAVGKISPDWPRIAEAKALVARLRAEQPAIARAHDAMMAAYAKKVKAQTEAENLVARRAYPKKAEKAFLDAGQDFYLTVEGKEFRTLRVRYVLMSRPLVHQLTNSAKVVDTWRDIGFRKVIFTDGYNSTWTWSLE